MNIAQTILKTINTSNIDFFRSDAISLIENHKELEDTDQNWEKETTTYTFTDNSKIIIHNDSVTAE